ncbi:hypothetical protein D9619_007519 [Psilocybe cf. subviscida]|uniref:DUF6535 domain-containing protein n=1 Tax=Psilocybe cf. subviscida TaxID=2480587 RepID=A0A8H5B1N2_9AGAR|nr:hypothetical protein D9619_007519 [Psilocybe cf. subviscida]
MEIPGSHSSNLYWKAGLFSAVVTAFAVETYKDLQEDPVVALLARIAANSANNSTTALPPPFTPDASTIRLNVFFFLSLILSLSTVLVGIVALQWIREHRQHSNTLTPQNMFATLHMRTEALHKWRVPQIFAALPLLLQFSLVFFFAGIIQLLVNASTIVLIPVTCVMGVTILFLVSTTILPTAQAVTLSYSGLRLNDEIPVPCPYKSPQAKAFRRLITSSKTMFKAMLFFFAAIYWIIFRLYILPRQVLSISYFAKAIQEARASFNRTLDYVSKIFVTLARRTSPLTRTLLATDNLKEWHGFDYMTPNIFYYWRLHSWLEFDLAWMSVRDNYFQSICPTDTWLFLNREQSHEYAALYDAAQGLCDELTRDNFNINVDPEPAIITAYHCALSLCFPSVGHFDPKDNSAVEALFTRNQYLATLLGCGDVTPLRPFAQSLRPSDFQVLWDETSFIFLYFIQEQLNNAGKGSSVLTNHFAETYLRLLSQLYSEPYEMDTDPRSVCAPEVGFEAEDLYVMKVYDAPNQPFTYQWALSISSFFRVLADCSIPYTRIIRSFHAHPFFRGYSANFWRQLKYDIHTGTVHENTTREVIHTLSLIDKALDECSESPDSGDGEHNAHSRSAFVLQSVGVYLWLFRHRHIDYPGLVPAVEETIKRLRDVTRTLNVLGVEVTQLESNSNSELDDDADQVPWFTSEWWAELFSEFSQSSDGGSRVNRTISAAHDEAIGIDRQMDVPSPPLPVDVRQPPPWPEPHSHPIISSSAPNWQLRKINTIDDIV